MSFPVDARRYGALMILVTGSEGLVGSRLATSIERLGVEVRRFDIRRSPGENVRDRDAVAAAVQGVDGIVHLAAVSRVVWGENDPALCEATNVDALRNLLALCAGRQRPPWFVFASSREVYGNAGEAPISEDFEFRPMNVYAKTKCEGERLVQSAAATGLIANICRLSSVYGSPHDHPDRVVMAFAGAAVHGGTMRVDGPSNTFDFTAVDDVVKGLLRLVELSSDGERIPPVHFVSGRGTTLLELAELAAAHAQMPVSIAEAPARVFDPGHFVGDPARAAALLGWRSEIEIEEGLAQLIASMSQNCDSQARNGPVRP